MPADGDADNAVAVGDLLVCSASVEHLVDRFAIRVCANAASLGHEATLAHSQNIGYLHGSRGSHGFQPIENLADSRFDDTITH
jgi:hypothetical protein